MPMVNNKKAAHVRGEQLKKLPWPTSVENNTRKAIKGRMLQVFVCIIELMAQNTVKLIPPVQGELRPKAA